MPGGVYSGHSFRNRCRRPVPFAAAEKSPEGPKGSGRRTEGSPPSQPAFSGRVFSRRGLPGLPSGLRRIYHQISLHLQQRFPLYRDLPPLHGNRHGGELPAAERKNFCPGGGCDPGRRMRRHRACLRFRLGDRHLAVVVKRDLLCITESRKTFRSVGRKVFF